MEEKYLAPQEGAPDTKSQDKAEKKGDGEGAQDQQWLRARDLEKRPQCEHLCDNSYWKRLLHALAQK